MLIQDSQTGYYHEAPDYNVAGYGGYAGHGGYGEMLYDGLGNPVGTLGDLWDIVKGVASNIPIVRGLVSKLIQGGGAPSAAPALPMPPMPPLPQLPMPPLPGLPSLPGMVSSMFPGGSPFPTCSPFPTGQPAPWPYRWIRPQGPLMAGHRRMYLRCTAWPGPEGLVPVDAATGLPGMPGVPTPGAPTPGVPGGSVHHRRRHRRRR